MYVTIYQVNEDRDTEKMKFCSLDRHPEGKIAPETYDEVFRGEVDCADLEQVYALFNNGGHPLFRGHSLSVVYVEPGKPAYESDIAMNLEGYQKAVGGFIELVYNRDGTILVCNDEGKLWGMAGNRHIAGGGIIAGPFFVCRDGGEDFCSLTDQQVHKYLDRFAQPEVISQDEVDSDMGIYFISL